MPRREFVPVWDAFVRLAHWLLVIAFFVAFVTEGEPLQPHVIAGYVAGVILVLRVIWGFIGSRHARFSDFVKAPGAVLTYTADHLRFRSPRFLGHSPAGGAMVVVIMVMLAATVISGLGTLAESEGEGPLAPFFSRNVADSGAFPSIVSIARASGREHHGEDHDDEDDRYGRDDHEEGERDEGPWAEAHDTLAHLTFFLALFHIAGVLFSSVAHRENLIWAMVTGRKRAESEPG